MKKNCSRSLDDLKQGIKHLLSQDRCSFSTDEKVLLIEILDVLSEYEKQKVAGLSDLSSIIRIVELLSRLFVVGIQIENNF